MSVMLAQRPDGREPESDYRGRIGAAAIPNAGGAVNADRSSRPSLPCPPSWRGLPRLPGAPNPLRTPSTVYHSSAPLIPPPCPYPYLPYVRLHCTMPCYGTSRVRTRVPTFGQTFPKVGPCQKKEEEEEEEKKKKKKLPLPNPDTAGRQKITKKKNQEEDGMTHTDFQILAHQTRSSNPCDFKSL